MVKMNPKLLFLSFLLYALGFASGLIAFRLIQRSHDYFLINLGMSEREVMMTLGKPLKTEFVFGIKAPDEWPTSAKEYLSQHEPVKIMLYGNTEIYISEKNTVCKIVLTKD